MTEVTTFYLDKLYIQCVDRERSEEVLFWDGRTHTALSRAASLLWSSLLLSWRSAFLSWAGFSEYICCWWWDSFFLESATFMSKLLEKQQFLYSAYNTIWSSPNTNPNMFGIWFDQWIATKKENVNVRRMAYKIILREPHGEGRWQFELKVLTETNRSWRNKPYANHITAHNVRKNDKGNGMNSTLLVLITFTCNVQVTKQLESVCSWN